MISGSYTLDYAAEYTTPRVEYRAHQPLPCPTEGLRRLQGRRRAGTAPRLRRVSSSRLACATKAARSRAWLGPHVVTTPLPSRAGPRYVPIDRLRGRLEARASLGLGGIGIPAVLLQALD